MTDEIPTTEARAQLSELINRVGFGKERIVLTRHGKPLVALVPAELLEKLEDAAAAAPAVLDLSSKPTSPYNQDQMTIAAQTSHTPEAR